MGFLSIYRRMVAVRSARGPGLRSRRLMAILRYTAKPPIKRG